MSHGAWVGFFNRVKIHHVRWGKLVTDVKVALGTGWEGGELKRRGIEKEGAGESPGRGSAGRGRSGGAGDWA